MTIQVGDKIPATTLKVVTPEGPKDVTSAEFFGGKKVVLFAVPGAFTPACSKRYSMLVENGTVKSINVEQVPSQVEVSSAEAMLKSL